MLNGAIKPVIFTGRAAYSVGREMYHVVTLGPTRGQAAFALAEALNTSAVSARYIAQTGFLPLYSARGFSGYGGASAVDYCNLSAWNKFKNRTTGGRDYPVAKITEAEELAEKIYQQIRLNNADVKSIAENTGMKEFHIERIKNHIFHNNHELRHGAARFDADPLIADAWNRLESGAFNQKDIQLLNHELFESKFEGIFKTDYFSAHKAADYKGYKSPIEGLNLDQIAELYDGFLHRFR